MSPYIQSTLLVAVGALLGGAFVFHFLHILIVPPLSQACRRCGEARGEHKSSPKCQGFEVPGGDE